MRSDFDRLERDFNNFLTDSFGPGTFEHVLDPVPFKLSTTAMVTAGKSQLPAPSDFFRFGCTTAAGRET